MEEKIFYRDDEGHSHFTQLPFMLWERRYDELGYPQFYAKFGTEKRSIKINHKRIPLASLQRIPAPFSWVESTIFIQIRRNGATSVRDIKDLFPRTITTRVIFEAIERMYNGGELAEIVLDFPDRNKSAE